MHQEYKFEVPSIEALHKTAQEIIEIIHSREINIILLSGSMGAGKTTLTKELCAAMDVDDVVTSPTFAIVNEYSTDSGESIFHFDVYRIDSIQEIIDIGYEEYLYSGNLCLIEWWQKMEQLIPDKSEPRMNIAEIEIEATTPTSRTITIRFR